MGTGQGREFSDRWLVGERRPVVSRGSGCGRFRAVGETVAVRCPIRPGALALSDADVLQGRCQLRKSRSRFIETIDVTSCIPGHFALYYFPPAVKMAAPALARESAAACNCYRRL